MANKPINPYTGEPLEENELTEDQKKALELEKQQQEEATKRDIELSQQGSAAQPQGTEIGAGYRPSNWNMYGTPEEIAAGQAGLNQASILYGRDVYGIGEDISRVRDIYRQRMEQSGADPQTAAVLGQVGSASARASRELAKSGVKGGVAAKAIAGITAQKEAEARESLYGQQGQTAQAFGRLTGNSLAGTVGLMKGSQAEQGQLPQYNPSGMFGLSAICTELYVQGKMPYNVYVADMKYGHKLSMERPEVLEGYHLWAKPLVRLMRKSQLFTNLIKYPALSWANHIAGIKPSLFGSFCQTFGEAGCAVLGKMILKFRRLYV